VQEKECVGTVAFLALVVKLIALAEAYVDKYFYILAV